MYATMPGLFFSFGGQRDINRSVNLKILGVSDVVAEIRLEFKHAIC